VRSCSYTGSSRPTDLVDVLRDLLDGAHRGGPVDLVRTVLVVELLHEEAEEAGLSDPVGAHEGGGVDVTLGQPAGVLDRRRRRLDGRHVEP
jgi:hypothetical protein